MNPLGRTCVIFNPTAGRGRSAQAVRTLRGSRNPDVTLMPTQFAGHATELAKRAADDGFATIVAIGGDGTVHEVANGILESGNRDAVLSIWPVGSANDYAYTLGLSKWWRGHRHELTSIREVDVGRVSGGSRSRYFVNGFGLGFNGAVTLESRSISWLRGIPLYGLAMLKAIWRHFEQPLIKVEFDDLIREVPTLVLSINLGQREGNFPITPRASLDDGLFDCIHAGPLTRWAFIKHLPAIATGNLPANDPRVWLGRAANVAVRSERPFRIHLDGEFFCHPQDGIIDVHVELLPKRLKVMGFP